MPRHLYLVALGSNMRSPRHGPPRRVLSAACAAMAAAGLQLAAISPTIRSAPIGPSLRQYANGAVLVWSNEGPTEMLNMLKQIERDFGRGSGRGSRWQARVLDLDIILWSGGIVAQPALQIPHPQFRKRSFVLGPAAAIAGRWRDPITNLSVSQLKARLTQPHPLPN